MKFLFQCLLFIIPLTSTVQAQISGTVKDQQGYPLPYASIYSKQSTIGTSSNDKGYFSLDLPAGKHDLILQYIGYETIIIPVNVSDRPQSIGDIQLKEQSVNLSEITVTANAEDPAYAIIRKVMGKRRYYLEQIKSYHCKSYIKSKIRMENMPESFMGQSTGDLGGLLDSTGRGILYLSETESELYYRYPEKFREILISSRVSGNDQGFGFNKASDLDFTLYETHTTFGRPILSPVAPGAFGYYDYRLIGSFPDQDGHLIYKIALIPKRGEDPVYQGHLYMAGEYWSITQAELQLNAAAMKQPGLESIQIKQVNVKIEEPDYWKTISQNIEFQGGLLGFNISGSFTGVFSSFELDPDLPEIFFGNAIFLAQAEALTRDSSYWSNIRPIPLTKEEKMDYLKKDSLQDIRKSPAYLDSLDKENNNFKIINLLTGYNWSNSVKGQNFSLSSPLFGIQFNTVQGWNGRIALAYNQEISQTPGSEFSLNTEITYGLAEKIWRPQLEVSYRFNRIQNTKLSLSGGQKVNQFNSEDPLGPGINTLYSLLGEKNHLKLYDKRFIGLQLESEPINGLLTRSSLEYSRRAPLFNNTGFSWVKNEENKYTANNPLDPTAFETPVFETHRALILDIFLRIRLRQKYARYPTEKINYPSNLPEILMQYTKGIPLSGSEVDFDKISLGLEQRDLPFGIAGKGGFKIISHRFLRRKVLPFMDYQHFEGNQTLWASPGKRYATFNLLPYYSHSTNDYAIEGHYEHNFKGFILDKIPGIRKLGLYLIAGTHHLYTPQRGYYREYHLGFDRIGIKAFRLLRLDLAAGKPADAEKWTLGWRLSLSTGGN